MYLVNKYKQFLIFMYWCIYYSLNSRSVFEKAGKDLVLSI